MSTITLGPDAGADRRNPDSTAYGLLQDNILNIVNWQHGYRYVTTQGRWWGFAQTSKTMDRPCDHRIINAGLNTPYVVLDSRLYVNTLTMPTVWDALNGYWTVDLLTSTVLLATSPVHALYLGASAGNTAASFVKGIAYASATSKALVGAPGLTAAGQLAGWGVWFAEVVAGNVLRLYIWAPLNGSQDPSVQWGGIAVATYTNGSEAVAGLSPANSALALESSASSSPHNSIIRPGFLMIGQRLTGVGNRRWLSVSNKGYDNLVASGSTVIGGETPYNMGSNVWNAGNSVNGGSCSDFAYDDGYLAETTVARTSGDYKNTSATEFVSVSKGVRDFTYRRGTVTGAVSHGFISFVQGDMETGAAVSQRNRAIGIYCISRARTGSWKSTGYSRAYELREMEDSSIENCTFIGMSEQNKMGGTRCAVVGNTSTLMEGSIVDLLGGGTGNEAEVNVFGTLQPEMDAMSVTYARNYVDRRGASARGVVLDLGVVNPQAYTGITIPANAFKVLDNTLLCDPGPAAMRFKYFGTGGTAGGNNLAFAGNRTNASLMCSVAAAGDNGVGTPTALSAVMQGDTGRNVTDTAARFQPVSGKYAYGPRFSV